jgi:hypothetical protein
VKLSRRCVLSARGPLAACAIALLGVGQARAAVPSTVSSAPASTTVTLGAAVTDSATVTGQPLLGAPSGTVTFYVCGPLTGVMDCSSAGNAVGDPVTVTPGASDDAAATSASFAPTAAGTWCFRAEYSGDAIYDPSSDASTGECVTVARAEAGVTSMPSSASTTLADGASDKTVLQGNPQGGSPTGAVSFFVCGPLATPVGCSSGGQPVGGPEQLSAASPTSSTLTSTTFLPTAPGVWCFRAEYSGDANYTASTDAGPGGCFTVLAPGHPSVTIGSPAGGAIYAVGQPVSASYSCAEAPGGPGLSSCTGSIPAASRVDTLTLGPHTLSVSAQSKDGLRSTVTVTYTVAGAPSVTISSPADGATYDRGQSVPVGFSCAENRYGPGLVACSAPSSVDTSKVGTFAFTADAASADGLRAQRTAHFRVVLPSNRFAITKLRVRRTGRITFRLALRRVGRVEVVAAALRHARSSSKTSLLLIARAHFTPRQATTLSVTLLPKPRVRSMLRHRPARLRVRIVVTYTPSGGVPGRHVFFSRMR